MSLRGIDISSWQGGIELDDVLPNVDFCIVKATGGTGYVNPYCEEWIDKCIESGKPFGFYHFADDGFAGKPYDEAMFFIEVCHEWFGKGIPILDWETNNVDDEWVNTFVNIVHSETGIWCWIYANAWRITPDTEQNCGRWVASYPSELLYPGLYDELPEPPYVDGLMCAWQFASDVQVPGYSGNLDGSVFFGDVEAWNKYAGVTQTDPVYEDVVEKIYQSTEFDIDIVWHNVPQ